MKYHENVFALKLPRQIQMRKKKKKKMAAQMYYEKVTSFGSESIINLVPYTVRYF